MADLMSITSVRVGADKLRARVVVSPGMPLSTTEDIEATARVYYLAPAIATHACLGDAGEKFQDCMGDTEIAHLLEHLTVEIMSQTGLAGEISCGRTRRAPDEDRAFDIELSCPDDVLVVGVDRDLLDAVGAHDVRLARAEDARRKEGAHEGAGAHEPADEAEAGIRKSRHGNAQPRERRCGCNRVDGKRKQATRGGRVRGAAQRSELFDVVDIGQEMAQRHGAPEAKKRSRGVGDEVVGIEKTVRMRIQPKQSAELRYLIERGEHEAEQDGLPPTALEEIAQIYAEWEREQHVEQRCVHAGIAQKRDPRRR